MSLWLTKSTYLSDDSYLSNGQRITTETRKYPCRESETLGKETWHQKLSVHVSGSMVPIPATASAPNAISTGDVPTTPIEFDGISMLLVPSFKQFTDACNDPCYIEVIKPDEREMLDKVGPGSGVVASFQGKMLDMLHAGKSSGDKKIDRCRELFEEFERKNGM